MAGGESEKSLEQTPTWAVATVCTVFVVCSLLVERGIFSLGRYLKRNKQKELFHTLEVIRNELMLLGFVSLFLTVFQPKIASICMPERLNHYMLPCAYKPPPPTPAPAAAPARRLLAQGEPSSSGNTCPPGKVQVISASGLHELHIFIFVLAVVHVLYSCVTVLLSLWQVHSWKSWENETRKEHHDHTVDDALGKHTHKKASNNFVTKRVNYNFLKQTVTGLNIDSYIYCFFRQFGRPIYKHDYLCLRLGFIAEHNLTPAYDFHSYIRRTMEADFKVVVGISWYLWAFVCIFLLMDIYGWYTYFWIAFIPTVTVLLVGMKLQQIITSLALEVMGGVERRGLGRRRSKPESTVSKKVQDDDSDLKLEKIHPIKPRDDDSDLKLEKIHPIKPRDDDSDLKLEKIHPIKPRDDLFWFNRPRLLLYIVHFMLFQNAFEFAFFFWGLFTHGFSSCLVGKRWMIIVRLVMGVLVQILCSVSTLPLYALVSQLGSNIRMNHVLSEKAMGAIHNWRDTAKVKAREQREDSDLPSKDSNGHSDHTIDIESSHMNGHHENDQRVNGESNGFHHPHYPTVSHENSHLSQGSAEAHNVEIREQGPAAK
ncbi:hypothetical protein M758_5G033600 [Ceratodon purpureus]|nr:hypothetical protein M758_5G033600 [Ceratodon purpureus]